jgi:RNA polymerase sigma-70 factor (ECF subfamily)
MSDTRNEWTLSAYPLAEAGEERQESAARLQEEVTLLFGQLRNQLLRYLLAFGLVVHDAEEIVQDVFLALFRHLEDRKPRTNLRAWVFRVAHNLALRQRYAAVESRQQMLETQHVDPAPNPEELALYSQRQRRLRSVLRALPEQDQWCLSLRAEGLRYREIADVLGISLGAVSLSLTRSLARLDRADKG